MLCSLNVAAQQMLPYQNWRLTPEQRADDLIKRLTIEEKARLMIDVSKPVDRLGVPQFQWWNEALHGTGRNGFATVFPITMGMAASWDDALLERCFSAASDEARAKNMIARRTGKVERYQCLSFWTPNINIFRDPRWGRGQETYGEDPYLTSRMGVAVVCGLQGPQDSKYMKTLACAKHYAVHSGPEWNRHTFNIEDLPERDLWETYLPAFKALVQEANVAEVMCAYQRIDGQPCCGQTRYLQQILRDEWGFNGIVVSDCGAIRDFHTVGHHEYTKTPEESTGKAVIAGTDVNCGNVYLSIPEAVKQGQLTEADVDRSLRRLLVARFRLGDMTPDSEVEWTKIPESVICSDANRALSYRMARESMVLLQNNNSILPLKKNGMKIAVVGPNANDSTMQWGNYNGYPKHTSTILEGIRQKIGNGSTVYYVGGSGHVENSVNESLFANLVAPDGTAGVKATYWNNTKMEGEPVATAHHTSAFVLDNGGNTVFAPGVELENFTARYEGTLCPKKDEHVMLKIDADDGMRLYINGNNVIDRFSAAHGMQTRIHEMDVKAGERYDIKIEYLQTSSQAHMAFDVYRKVEMTQDAILAQLKDADVVVFVGGISPRLEGEEMKVNAEGFKGGDRTDIQLPKVQRNLIKAIHDSGKQIVYVNCSGSALALVPETENCEAILQAWYPGERGGEAVADVLFGDYNPSGKLPVTFYRSVDDLPDFLDYTMKGRTYRYFEGDPLWSFGYGLSYTSFEIGKPKYKNAAVTVSVKNTGKTDGDEVVQVYIRRVGDVDGPQKALRAYQRVSLKAGEQRELCIDMPKEAFEVWDKETNTMRPVPGKYELMVGNSSRNADLKTIKVKL